MSEVKLLGVVINDKLTRKQTVTGEAALPVRGNIQDITGTSSCLFSVILYGGSPALPKMPGNTPVLLIQDGYTTRFNTVAVHSHS